jgi:hypothetical protein
VAAEPKAPRKTASQKRAEASAERLDAWNGANTVLRRHDWAEGLTPYDVFQLAQWLAGDVPD